jgi:hypothetical protein
MNDEPYDPGVHGAVSIGVLHARMIKCIGIDERYGEQRYGVCPHASHGDRCEGWRCTAGGGETVVSLTVEHLRDPRMRCPRANWSQWHGRKLVCDRSTQ